MKKLFFILSLLTTISTYSQQKFEKQWAKVEAFELVGKTKSANEIVTTIFKKAKKKNNSNQLIKSLLYQSKFALVLQEDTELLVTQNLEQEISIATFPTNAILQSVLADFKWQYLQQHRWEIYNRTKTTEIINNDFRTWDLNSLFTSIHHDFKQSIASTEQLQLIPITNYNYIIIKGTEKEHLRPTLYDLLANRALWFFKTNESRITKPKEQFHIDNDSYFSTSPEFTELNIETTDSIFSKYEVLKTYQLLEQFHLQNKNTEALADVYINRLNFIKNNSVNHQNSTELHNQSLKKTYTNLPKGNAYATIKASYAKAIYDSATLEKSPKNRATALNICNEIIKNYPKSEGFAITHYLKNKILHKNIQLQNEEIIPINKHSKVLVNFQNIEQLHLAIYKVDYKHNFNLYDKKGYDVAIKLFFKTEQPVKEFTTQLPLKKDYFNHSTEVVLPKLSSGKYLILATKDATKNTNGLFAYNYQTVSNLVCIESNYHGEKLIQVLDRTSGKPIEKAKVKIDKKIKHTNSIGELVYSNVHRHQVKITYLNDTLILGDRYGVRYYEKTTDQSKKVRSQGFLFLDRSIYRPGKKCTLKELY